jgi:hypothetical protein
MYHKGFSQNLLDVIPFGFSPNWAKAERNIIFRYLAKAQTLLHLHPLAEASGNL